MRWHAGDSFLSRGCHWALRAWAGEARWYERGLIPSDVVLVDAIAPFIYIYIYLESMAGILHSSYTLPPILSSFIVFDTTQNASL